ncbi:MAG: 50S ribosomal protein L22 [Candidatus Promineifilaceae bacterium]|jgi:large subunit ribosomal protein L22
MADLFEVRAVAKHIPISPRKMRMVVDVVRGMNAEQALDTLRFMPNRAAEPVYKLIQSAVANAEENYGLEVEELQVSRIYADDGPRRRKAPYGGRFAGRGRFRPIVRRSSHITVILAEREIED